MGLGDRGDVAVLEALDHVHLPQRAAAVERSAEDVGRELGQLGGAAGSRQGRPSHVVVDVEVGVLDPQRVVELERDLDEAPPERRQQVEPALDELDHLLEGVAAGDGGRVEDGRRRHVHVDRRRLEIEEGGIESGEPLHLPTLARVWAGVDVGLRRLHVVTLDGRCRVACAEVVPAAERGRLLDLLPQVRGIAVDSPGAWSTAPHAGDGRAAQVPPRPLQRDRSGPDLPDLGAVVDAPGPGTGHLDGHRHRRVRHPSGCRARPGRGLSLRRVPAAGGRAPSHEDHGRGPGRPRRPAPVGGRRGRVPRALHDFLDAALVALVARHRALGTARVANCGHDTSGIWLPAG